MKTMVVAVACWLAAATAWGGSVGGAVEVRVVADNGRSLPLYPAKSHGSGRRVYAEAVKGESYSIEVRNRLDRRMGVVVAVDGRNIITGAKSWLGNGERMYILEPYETGTFSGWRTGTDRVNRFYFTNVADSYAAAFKDESAMGVIAVAAYPELLRYRPMEEPSAPAGAMRERSANRPAPASPMAKAESDNAGTGYGREEYSPVRTVEFEPEGSAAERIFIKYEWRSTLCRLGVIACRAVPPRPRNRLWDDDVFAPPPPGR